MFLSPLMDSFLMFDNRSTFASLETILFVREVIELHPEHRESIFMKICDSFEDIRSHLVIRVALWIIGEYATNENEVEKAFETIKKNIGSLPLLKPDEEKEEDSKQQQNAGPKVITKTIILPDGSYGTETIVIDDPMKAKALQALNQSEDQFPLRKSLTMNEDDYLGSCLCVTLTKLVLKMKKYLKQKKSN